MDLQNVLSPLDVHFVLYHWALVVGVMCLAWPPQCPGQPGLSLKFKFTDHSEPSVQRASVAGAGGV